MRKTQNGGQGKSERRERTKDKGHDPWSVRRGTNTSPLYEPFRRMFTYTVVSYLVHGVSHPVFRVTTRGSRPRPF